MPAFLGRIRQLSVRNTVDLAKTSRLTIDTEEPIAALLDGIPADVNVKVTIEAE